MNIYNSILTFSNDFKNCDEVKEFKKLKKKIDENAENKKIIDDFHKKLYDYQIAFKSLSCFSFSTTSSPFCLAI